MIGNHPKVYLDNCCYNRPYDDQSNPKVHLEAQAKILIQDMVRLRQLDLVTSTVLEFEMNNSPYDDRKLAIGKFINEFGTEKVRVGGVAYIKAEAQNIMDTGVKFYDAYHVACAIYADCDYFLSTDKRLLKYQSDKIKIMNPVDFIRKVEINDD